MITKPIISNYPYLYVMQALRYIETAENGLLKLILPKEFENAKVEVIVLPYNNPVLNKERKSLLQKFKGDASFPDIDTLKSDVYTQ